jgi:hypothetical protein
MNFSTDTLTFLGSWFSGGGTVGLADVNDNIIADLKLCNNHSTLYTPSSQITLYRGLKEDDIILEYKDVMSINFSDLNSWTYSKEMAVNFTETTFIITTTVNPSQVFLDSTTLNSKFIANELGGFPEEVEVILIAGTYNIVKISKDDISEGSDDDNDKDEPSCNVVDSSDDNDNETDYDQKYVDWVREHNF